MSCSRWVVVNTHGNETWFAPQPSPSATRLLSDRGRSRGLEVAFEFTDLMLHYPRYVYLQFTTKKLCFQGSAVSCVQKSTEKGPSNCTSGVSGTG